MAVYEVVIYKKNGNTFKTENINDFNNGSDLLTLFQKLPSTLSNGSSTVAVHDLAAEQKRLRINTDEFKPFGRIVSGELETGHYGTENSIVDKDGKTVGTKNKDHSTMTPFYFVCDLEKNLNRALLILQRFSQFGVYTIFSQIVKKEFEKSHQNYTLRISPLVSKRALDAVIKKGILKKISFVSADRTKNAANVISKNSSDYFNTDDVYCEYNVVARRNKGISLINSLTKILGVDARVSDYISVREFDYNNVKMLFKINGRNQTISVNNWHRFSPDIDITDKVRMNERGFPIKDDVEVAALELLNDIKSEMSK